MTEASTIFALLFALLCGLAAMVHSLKARQVTLLSWALLAMGGMYGIGWAVVLQVTEFGGNPFWVQWILPFRSEFLFHHLGSLLLLAGVPAGWYLTASVARRQAFRENGFVNFRAASWSRAFWFLLLLAVVSQVVYTHAYGGPLGRLEYANLIRSALFYDVPPNSFSFLSPFGGLAMIAAFGFFGLWLARHKNHFIGIGFVLAFLLSLYVLFSWLGRLGFLVFLSTFVLAWAMYRIRSPLRLIAIGGGVFTGLLVGAYWVSVLLNIKPADNLLEFLAQELSFPFASFYAQLAHGEHLFRGFRDFLLAPAFLLPSSWWVQWIEPVDQLNTAIIMGAPKGVAGVTGSIPVDLLTLGMMQLHLPGIFFTGMLFGALLRVVHAFLCQIPCRGVRAVFTANLALTLATLSIFYSQPNLVIFGHIHWLAAALILVVLLRTPVLRLRTSNRHSIEGFAP